jgi:hypothetical protein
MDEDTRITWLRRVLIFKILVVLLMWGLPTWLAPEPVLKIFGETMPDNPFYMRIFGGVQIGLVFLYWFAYRNPVRNRDIIRYAVIDNSLSFITIIGFALTVGVTNPTIWVSAVLVAFFAIAFYLLIPKVPETA